MRRLTQSVLPMFLISFLGAGAVFGGPAIAGSEPALTLENALATALADNPGLAQMQARAEAMAAIPSQAGTLPDPMVSFNAMNLPTDTFDRTQEAMTQLQVGISQTIPFPGKLGLKEQAAEYEAAAAENDVDEMQLLLLRDVKATWWRLFFLDRALEVVAGNQNLLRQFVEITQVRYKVGEGLQQDVLLAQLELSKLLDQELQLTARRRTERARFNALLNRPADRPVPLPLRAPETLPTLRGESALYELADSQRPLLTRRRNTIDAADSRLDLAKKEYLPDFRLGAAYGFRGGRNPDGGRRADFATFQLSANVPIFAHRKQSKAVDQRHSELLERQYALQDEWVRIQAEIAAALADYRRAREQVQLFKTGIIPQAQQTVNSMLAGYQVDKVDFLNLVTAQITLFNYEIQYWQALSEANQSRARLVAAVGTEQIHE